MSTEIAVLRALLRLSRRTARPTQPEATLDELVARVGGEPAEVLRALRSLARAELVQRTPAGPRLSLAGLAVAVACGSAARSTRPSRVVRPARASIVAKPRIAPMLRRRRAA